jgi:hypothetical protein
MLGWDQYGFHKKCVGTRYAKLIFLHPVGCAGHVVHSVASGAQNVDALLFIFQWDRFRLNKKRVETRYTKLVFWLLVVYAGHVVDFVVFGA